MAETGEQAALLEKTLSGSLLLGMGGVDSQLWLNWLWITDKAFYGLPWIFRPFHVTEQNSPAVKLRNAVWKHFCLEIHLTSLPSLHILHLSKQIQILIWKQAEANYLFSSAVCWKPLMKDAHEHRGPMQWNETRQQIDTPFTLFSNARPRFMLSFCNGWQEGKKGPLKECKHSREGQHWTGFQPFMGLQCFHNAF